ncbi:MAG: hypothetical protein Q9174_004499, partial [Haloplaca sp. 1 TL-2023]
KALKEGLRHHVARLASRKPVDPRNTEEFTRPVRLHRRDPRIPLPGREDLAAEGGEGAIDQKQKELLDAQRAERRRQQAIDQAQIAPSAHTSGQRKVPFGKKTQQVYRNDQTDEQRAASQLRYEEALPWHLEDFDNKSTWVGAYESALSETYALFVLGPDDKFRMTPVEKWYKFTAKQQFKILTTDEAEKVMSKKFTQPKWFMDHQKAMAMQKERDQDAKAAKNLYIGKIEAQHGKAAARIKAEPDADDLDFEEDRFADDEENPHHEGPEEDKKEVEEKVKREQLRANIFDNRDEEKADAEDDIEKAAEELQKALGRSVRKALINKEKKIVYDDDSENYYSEVSGKTYSLVSDDEGTEAEKRKEEEKQKAEDKKGDASDREKSKAGKTSKTPSGANTPSGRPSKHANGGLTKVASANNLKRAGSPNASDLSGNESARSRKKVKKQHLAPPTTSTTSKPPSRPMSPEHPLISSASQRPSSTAPENLNNKRARADAGSGSEMSGAEGSDGARKKQKLKLRMSASPKQSPNGSRAVSPDLKATGNSTNGVSAAAAAKGSSNPPSNKSNLDISPDEARALIPTEGIMLVDLAKIFQGRLRKENLMAFKAMVKTVSVYDEKTKKFMPM